MLPYRSGIGGCCCIAPGRRFVFTHNRWQHFSAQNDGRHFKSTTSHVNRWVITRKIILPDFMPIQFETNVALDFFEEGRPNKKNKKKSSDLRSVPDLKIIPGHYYLNQAIIGAWLLSRQWCVSRVWQTHRQTDGQLNERTFCYNVSR